MLPVVKDRSTLLSFFPVVSSVVPRNVRRPLDTPTPPPRKKPMTAGRTNPSAVSGHAGIAEAVFHRTVRPMSVAAVHRPSVVPSMKTVIPGSRIERDEPLTVEDLWRPGNGPPSLDGVADEDRCSLCLQLKSHPVL
jgi:hypothetical protein